MKNFSYLKNHNIFLMKIFLIINLTLAAFNFNSCGYKYFENKNIKTDSAYNSMEKTINVDTATFGAGCFWCVEAQFQLLDGVLKVISGFSGGIVKNPTYKEVCNGNTGHAEVCQILFDPTKISYDELLAAFWQSHDPTQLNRQGNDFGTQYRSVIFYHNPEQKELAEKYKKELTESKTFDYPVVTEISSAGPFYVAEGYHQNYFIGNGDQPYCRYVIQPKVEKFKKVFKGKIK